MGKRDRPVVDPGRKPARRGGRKPKLTENQVDEIVRDYNAGKTQKALAETFAVSVATIRRYLKKRTK